MPAFTKIDDRPMFAVRLPSGERKRCDPWEALQRASGAKTEREQRNVVARMFDFPDGFSLTPSQCLNLIAGMWAYVDHADEAYRAAATNAEILMLYGGAVTIRDLREMDDLEKLALLSHGYRLEARRRLDFQDDISSMLSKDTTLRAELTRVAYADNQAEQDKRLEILSRVA